MHTGNVPKIENKMKWGPGDLTFALQIGVKDGALVSAPVYGIKIFPKLQGRQLFQAGLKCVQNGKQNIML